MTWRSRLLRVTERSSTYAQVNRPLRAEFTTVLSRLEWDLALLQEAPPQWLGSLCRDLGASGAAALTARYVLHGARAALARELDGIEPAHVLPDSERELPADGGPGGSLRDPAAGDRRVLRLSDHPLVCARFAVDGTPNAEERRYRRHGAGA